MKKILAWVLYISLACSLGAKDITEVQSIDASQRNQITGGGGGSSSGGVQSNTSTIFTTNQYFTGYVGINSNNFISGTRVLITRPTPGNVDNYSLFYAPSGGAGGIVFGDTSGGVNGSLSTDGANNVQLDANGTGFGSFFITAGGSTMFRATASTITLGGSSSHAITMNAATMAIPNGFNIGSGQLNIPTTGTLTNGSSFTSLNTVQGSNIVATTVNGTSSLSSGTNLTFNIDANNGGGTINTLALFTTRTNTLTAALPLINVIYTNNTSRLFVSAGVNLPTGLTTISAAALWTVSGSQTNYYGMAMSSAGFAGAVTNTVSGWVQPNALYAISNITTTAGTPSLSQGLYNEVRQ